MRVMYNEIDHFCVRWLKRLGEHDLIPKGYVNRDSIAYVRAVDVVEYDQCHFFAGIGGWAYALKLADWQGPVWTGSCPCQPFSSAAHGRNTQGKHLWSTWFKLIKACRPSVVFGEQVANARCWFDGVCDDMEALDYSVWATVLPACSVGTDHKRSRIFFACYSYSDSKPRLQVDAEMDRMPWSEGTPRNVPVTNGVPRVLGQCCAYGNAVVPQVAATFIQAFQEATGVGLAKETKR